LADVETHVVIRGRVQGVYFRASLQRVADLRGVCGWARNRLDGSVEALLQGPESAVQEVVAWAQVGPRGAVVEAVEVTRSEVTLPLSTFEVG
jgi:acylphosphatase